MRALQVDHIASFGGVSDGPGRVIHILNEGMLDSFDRPLRLLIKPATIHIHRGLPDCIHDDRYPGFLKPFGELGHEKLGTSIIFWWDGNERWSD